jgi:hypothetical protein
MTIGAVSSLLTVPETESNLGFVVPEEQFVPKPATKGRSMNRIDACKAERLPVPSAAVRYTTHLGYVHALQTLLECMRARIAGSEERIHGSSPFEIRNRLIGMVVHAQARADCAVCPKEVPTAQQAVLDVLPAYLKSAHAEGPDGYAKISADLPPVSDASDGAEGGPLFLLKAWTDILVDASPRKRRANRHRPSGVMHLIQ